MSGIGTGSIIRDPGTRDRYILIEKLGDSVPDDGGSVYKAERVPGRPPPSPAVAPLSNFVAFKLTSAILDEDFTRLDNSVRGSYRPGIHNNVVGINTAFTRGHLFYVSMPYMDEGSLRHIISARFNNGLPEDCIAVALREALLGLSFLHSQRRVHKHFCAANIFVDRASIKLAFEASMYEHDPYMINQHHGPGGSSTSALDLKEITKWAAAPEVYGRKYSIAGASAAIIAKGQKADIWLVGITALELAYGCLPVADRQDLKTIIKKITKKQILPTFEKLKEITYNAGIKISKGKKLKMYLQKKVKLALRNLKTRASAASGSKQKEEEANDDADERRVFSRGFEKMVAKCLAKKPEKRPTADELLRTNFIRNSRDINHFKRVVLSAKGKIKSD